MARHFLFLSYKRGAVTTPVVERFFRRVTGELHRWNVEPFFDRKSIEAGDVWELKTEQFLAKATLFVAFISIDFWLSEQCQRELDLAVRRYEQEQRPKLLFVLADQLDPNDLAFDVEGATKQMENADVDDAAGLVEDASRRVRKVRTLGNFNFLGPYDQAGMLVRLKFESPLEVDDQLAQLIRSIKSLEGMRRD